MKTAVVSGRVSLAVRERAERVIRQNGLTAADVVKRVWEHIAQSGELPASAMQAPDAVDTRAFDEFATFVGTLRPAAQEFASSNEAQLRAILEARDA